MNKRHKIIFLALFFALFATITGVGIVVPLLPVYAADLGASGFYIGLIFGAFSLSRTIFLPYFGRLSDSKGRKPFIVIGLFCYTLISFLFIYVTRVESLILVRLIQGVASAMIMPVLQAYVGDITPVDREGVTMGLFNLSMFLGLSCGPLIGGVIKDQFNLQTAFIGMGGLTLIGFLLCVFLLPPVAEEPAIRRTRQSGNWRSLLADQGLLALLNFRFVHATCIGIVWSFLPVYADAQFSLSSSSIGILVMIGVFISGLMHVPMGAFADKSNKSLLIVVGGLILAYGTISFEWADGFAGLMVSGVLLGIGGGIAMPALMAMAVIKGNHTGAMGAIMALITLAHSLGMLVGSLLGGIMMDIWRLRYVFPLGAAIVLTGTIVFGMMIYRSQTDR